MSRKNTGRTPPQNLQNLQQAEARQLACSAPNRSDQIRFKTNLI